MMTFCATNLRPMTSGRRRRSTRSPSTVGVDRRFGIIVVVVLRQRAGTVEPHAGRTGFWRCTICQRRFGIMLIFVLQQKDPT